MDKVKVKYSFAFKLSLYILTCFVITFLSVLIYNYHVSKNIVINDAKEDAEILTKVILAKVNGEINIIQRIAEDISYVFEYSKPTENQLLTILKDVIKSYDGMYSCSVAFEPYMFDKTKYYFNPYFYKQNNSVKYLNNEDKNYNYFKSNWYTIPKKLNTSTWIEPYFDERAKNILMLTYSFPFFTTTNGEKKLSGVIVCSIDLKWLEIFLNSIKVFKTGYVFMLSANGVFIGFENENYYKSGKDISSFLAKKRGNVNLKELKKTMISKQTGIEEYYSSTLGKKCFISYQPLEKTGWFICVVVSEDELFSNLNIVTLKLFIMGLVGYILTLVTIIILANKMTIPLRSLASATYKIGKGDLNVKLPTFSTTDEIGVLSQSFCIMQESLIKYIANLQETTVAKEKIEKELSIAREIQQGLLPHKFPNLKQIDLYATLIPAREVGGDLYDFFFIDEKHLCFAIGDVSGKGVPSALFMAIAKTLLRAKISLTIDPAKILNAMNEDLCKENESFMFVTFFLGILNIETGLLEYCNAGHNPPLIHTTKKDFYYLHTEDAHPPLGIGADVNYVGNRLKLLPEDIFFLYTDGVTEAMNIDNIPFSEEKLLDILAKKKDETVENISNNVKMAVAQHVSGAIQSDDITMFILKYNG